MEISWDFVSPEKWEPWATLIEFIKMCSLKVVLVATRLLNTGVNQKCPFLRKKFNSHIQEKYCIRHKEIWNVNITLLISVEMRRMQERMKELEEKLLEKNSTAPSRYTSASEKPNNRETDATLLSTSDGASCRKVIFSSHGKHPENLHKISKSLVRRGKGNPPPPSNQILRTWIVRHHPHYWTLSKISPLMSPLLVVNSFLRVTISCHIINNVNYWPMFWALATFCGL